MTHFTDMEMFNRQLCKLSQNKTDSPLAPGITTGYVFKIVNVLICPSRFAPGIFNTFMLSSLKSDLFPPVQNLSMSN